MTTHTFSPEGVFKSESKNLRGLLDNAKRRGVERINILPLPDNGGWWEAQVRATYLDGYYSVTNFASLEICKRFFEKRWPGKVFTTENPHASI